MSQKTITIECDDCIGTGIYVGFCERKGTGVICLHCHGTGYINLSCTLFTKRHKRKDIQYVSKSRGSFIGTGVGAIKETRMTYKEFLNIHPDHFK